MWRWRTIVLAWGALTALHARAFAADLQATVKVPAQVRDGYYTDEAEAPIYIYTDLGLNRLRHGLNFETYFRLYENFGPNEGDAQFYSGVLRLPYGIPYTNASLGRQFLSEGPRGANLADSGRLTFDTSALPVSLTAFGGAPRYFEPTFSSPSISQDEQMFGARMNLTNVTRGYANLGYLQYIRDGETLSELVQLNAGRSYPDAPLRPNVYGYVSYDADNANLYMAQLGTQLALVPQKLLGSFDAGYYDPQGTGTRYRLDPNLAQDPLFQQLSISDELRFRGSLRYLLSKSVSAFANLGYMRYEVSEGVQDNGYLGGAGLHWLPGGDGLESVRLEYYTADSRGGILNGARFYYDNWVYDRIHFRTKVDVAYYEKITNQEATAVATLLGLGYDLLPGLYCEAYMEGNRNERFDADIRFGLWIVYDWSHRFGQKSAPGAASAASTGEPAAPAGAATGEDA